MQNIKTIKKLPDIEEIIADYPMDASSIAQVQKDRSEVKEILSGKDHRLLVILGPCSAWPSEAVLEYGKKLKSLNELVKDKLKLIMRVYIQKPRTTKGWTGPVNQPNPFAEPDIEAGARYARYLMVELIKHGIAIADEAVFTHNAKGFIELLSWVAIGARSTEDQEHRIFASSIEAAVGMKNPTSGSIQIGINSVIAAQHPHTAVFDGYQVETRGNDFAHLVLRGGNNGPNFHLDKLYKAQDLLNCAGVNYPAVIIDTSHENCRVNGIKKPEFQADVIREVLHNLRAHPKLQDVVKGFMLESFLLKGSQKLSEVTEESINRNGLSITDPCLGWEETKALILDMAELFDKVKKQ